MKKENPVATSIKHWSPEDRPREKLLMKGTQALSDAELLAILIGTGSGKHSAVDLAKGLLMTNDHSIDNLARCSVKDLMKTKGIGEAKAISIVAALELGRRRKHSGTEAVKIGGSSDAFNELRPHLQDKHHEEFWILLLNRANRVIRKYQVSQGGVAGTVADPKIIYKTALAELASGIILAHNHPSGNLIASQADLDLTRKLKEAGRLLEIQVLDHLIIANDRYLSFADEGLL
jgi:DNA repair protein RadC